jgi:hypothetical protein
LIVEICKICTAKELNDMFTCFIKYQINQNKIEEFKEYASIWIKLIEKYGGIHHGYFLPIIDPKKAPNTSFSFPDIGVNGPSDIAIALFSFQNLEKYETYKKSVKNDPDCKYITERLQQNPCFISYERTFLEPFFDIVQEEDKNLGENNG